MRKYFTFILVTLSLNLIAQQRQLSPTAMRADLHVLYDDAWTTLHPGLYRYNTPEQITGYFETLKRQCALPLPEKKFYLLLSQLAQKVKCGHTYLNPLNLDSATAIRLLPDKVIPVFFSILNKRQMVITKTLGTKTELRTGDEILAINGIPVRRIMDSLLTVSRSDGNHSQGKKYNNINETPDEATGYSLFDIYFPLFFKITTPWQLTVKAYRSHQIHIYQLMPLSFKDRTAAYVQLYGPVPSGERSWAYQHLTTQTAYLKCGTFAFWNSLFNEKHYVDSVFNDLNNHPEIKNIIVDIRNNEGGDNTGSYILSYLTDRKLGCDDHDHPCYRFLTVPDTLLPYLHTWDNSFKAPKNPADFFTNHLGLHERIIKEGDCAYIEPQAKRFKGKLYLLINAKNSSAGYEMARNVKINKLGTLIGETTGGSQQGINGGEFFFLTLPKSKLEIDLPLIFNYHPNKPDEGIIPDVEILTRQGDVAKNIDAQLNFVLSQIKGGK